MFSARLIGNISTLVAFGLVIILAAGCPPESDNAVRVLLKATHVTGCQGCLPELDNENETLSQTEDSLYVETNSEDSDAADQSIYKEEQDDSVIYQEGQASESSSVEEEAWLFAEEPSAHQPYHIMLPGDIPIEMVWIPAGTFIMGAYPGEEDSEADEGPQREVTLTKGFWMGKYEINQAQWLALMPENPSCHKGASLPVGGVSWPEAQAFIDALNVYLQESGQGGVKVRLPYEAEWEYACRAGSPGRYYWGDDPENTHLDDHVWHAGNSACSTYPGGVKLPNAFGLYDMLGNVFEWCQDWYGCYPEGSETNPVGPAEGSHRVLRGGSMREHFKYCRSANRGAAEPDAKCYKIGFRIAADTVVVP